MRFGPLLSALALAGCAYPPTPPMDAAASLAAAETAFAAQSVREDMRAAFLAHFADDGVFVRNGWTNGNAYLATQRAPPIVLDWRPVFTEVAHRARWGCRPGRGSSPARRSPMRHPRSASSSPCGAASRADGRSRSTSASGTRRPRSGTRPRDRILRGGAALTRGGIESAELEFVTDAHPGRPRFRLREAWLSERLRFYRDGGRRPSERPSALGSPAMSGTKLAWIIDRTEMSRSRDFGYARGSYAAVDSAEEAARVLHAGLARRGRPVAHRARCRQSRRRRSPLVRLSLAGYRLNSSGMKACDRAIVVEWGVAAKIALQRIAASVPIDRK